MKASTVSDYTQISVSKCSLVGCHKTETCQLFRHVPAAMPSRSTKYTVKTFGEKSEILQFLPSTKIQI